MKRIIAIVLLLAALFAFFGCDEGAYQKYTDTYFDYFDTSTSIIGYERSQSDFNSTSAFVEQELSEYHKLFDIYNEYDGMNNLATINKVVDGEHTVVEVDSRIIDLLSYSKEVYNITAGEVNVAMGSVLSLWHKCRTAASRDPASATLPDENELLRASQHTDISALHIDREASTVYISDPEMTLDVGAIAKGYTAEMIAKALESRGISGYLLNLGGNVRTVGAKPDGASWTVGITNPEGDVNHPYLEYLSVSGKALVTSGTYQRFYIVDGKSYHHIIDKDTCYPSEYYTSVSVLSGDSALADALSTALFSMDIESALGLIEKTDDAEALFVDKSGKKTYSSGFLQHVIEEK